MTGLAAALLAVALAHAGSKGSAKEPVGSADSRFAVFAGAASDHEPILIQKNWSACNP